MSKFPLSRLASKVVNTPLMILPDKLDVIFDVIGGRIGVDSVEMELTGQNVNARKEQTPTLKDVAVVPVYGSLVNRTHGLDAMSGLTTYDSIRNDFNAALESDAKAILFDIDSPGGEASGVMDLSDEIFKARGAKPIYAMANENAFSAAYAIASAADKIFLTRTGHVGSIGVIAVHKDQSAANEKAGIKYTTVYKGDRKADLSPHAPLSDEAKAMLEEEVEDHYELFTKTVARNRGIRLAQVVGTQAGIFMGEKAVSNHLADAVGSFNEIGEMILADLANLEQEKEEVDMAAPTKETEMIAKEVKIMDAQELREKYPSLVNEIEAGVKSEMTAQFAKDKEAMNEKLLKLEKAEMLRQEREIVFEAKSIWAQALANSDIPERLHDKVMVQVSHDKFVKDGLLDREGFGEAVKAEVGDWESRGATSQVMGVGFVSRDVEDSDVKKTKLEAQVDEDMADAIFKAAGGR